MMMMTTKTKMMNLLLSCYLIVWICFNAFVMFDFGGVSK